MLNNSGLRLPLKYAKLEQNSDRRPDRFGVLTMKKACLMLLAAAVLLMTAPSQACAEASAEPVLITYYRQLGWGDRVEIGYVDSAGSCWLLTGSDSELKWPYRSAEQIRYLSEHSFEMAGSLSSDDLFALKSLVYAVEPSTEPSHPAANDAGTERTYAVRYGRDGTPEPVLLGMSGDDMFENTDPNAQGLYLAARRLFPRVTAYGGSMGPAGFTPVKVSEFCGLGRLAGATVKAVFNDCEAGPREIALCRAEQKEILRLAGEGLVTGKVSAVSTTGGFRTYYFYRGGKCLGSFDICDGLLYRNDGMYSITSAA